MGTPVELHATWADVVHSKNLDLPQDQPQEGAPLFISLLGSPHVHSLLDSQSS